MRSIILIIGSGKTSSSVVERIFNSVGDGGGGEFTPNIDSCTNGLISREGETSVILLWFRSRNFFDR